MNKKTISERIWAKLHDHHGDLDDDFECIAHDADDIEKQFYKLEEYTEHLLRCELSDNTLEMARRKGLGYTPSCTCGLYDLLNDKA